MVRKTKISEGNSTVLPAEIRKALNLGPGDILQWQHAEGIITIRPRRRETIQSITGIISCGGDAVSDKRRSQSGDHDPC